MSEARTPARPDAPAGAARPGRRWLPTIVLAVVMGVTVLGGFVVAETFPVPEVRPVSVGGVLSLRPLPGWEVVRRREAELPSPTGGGEVAGEFTQLTRGSGALDVLALPGLGGTPADVAGLYAERVLSFQLERLAVSDELEHIVLANGLQAARFGYIGTEPRSGGAIEGSVTAVVSGAGNAAVFDGWAAEGQLELVVEEIRAMIDAAEVA